MHLVGANPSPQVVGLDELPGKSHYFIGNDPQQWHTDIPTYARVQYRDIYPGIDLIYYGSQRQLEHDFVVAPGADPKVIQLAFDGLVGAHGRAPLEIDAQGEITLHTSGGEIRLHKPRIYQEIDGVKQPIPGGYVLLSPQSSSLITFHVAAYDTSKLLIIDPVLSYSTYLGGSGDDSGIGIAVDSFGNAYVTGEARSTNFPTVSPLQAVFGGGTNDAFVTKINAAGSALVYSTYLGGSGNEVGRDIAVDSSGNAYVAGFTYSTNFPTVSPLQAANGGGADAFVAKLNPAGSALVYSTYLGGSGDDNGYGIAVDSSGSAYVAVYTCSSNFPTVSPLQATYGGACDASATKVNATGSALVYSTYLGGSGDDTALSIAVDSSGNAYVTGRTRSTNFPTVSPLQATYGGGIQDVFVTKINAAGSALVYSTYLGGSGDDNGNGIAVDSSGSAYVTGYTQSTNFPTVSPFQAALLGTRDAFVTKLNAAGNALVYSTYLGGSGSEEGVGIAVDSSGNAYVTGKTASTNFPTASPLQPALGGAIDAFVTKLNPAGNALVYSTYLGGSGNELDSGGVIAVDSSGNAYVTGNAGSTNFPTVNPLQAANGGGSDAFVAKIVEEKSLSVSPTSLTFGEVTVGSTKDLTFTAQNIGKDTLRGTVNSPASPFSLVSGGGSFSLGAGATQTVIVRFSPTSSGSFGGVVNITSSGGSASVTLSGTGTVPSGPALSVCGTVLDFGSVVVGSSKDLSCSVTNAGTGTLTGTATTVPPFSLLSGSPLSLGAGQSGTLTLHFTPSSASPAEGVLSFSSNGGNPTVTLRGTGTQGSVLTVSPTTVNFGGVRVGGNKDLPLTVQNTGAGALTRTVCAPSPFSLVSGDSFSLAANQSQTLTLRFSPPSTGSFNGTVTFSSTPCSNPQPDPAVVTVNGMGESQQASGRSYVVNRGSNSVSVIDTATQQVITTIPVGTQPVALALTPDESKVYVVNRGSSDVSVINTATLQVDKKTIQVGFSPAAIVITPNGQRAYVANYGDVPIGTVSIVDITTDTPLGAPLPVFRPLPSVLVLSLDGKVLYVLGPGSPLVGVVDTTTNQINSIRAGVDPIAATFSPDGRRAYIANQGDDTVSIFDTTTFPPTQIGANVPLRQQQEPRKGPNSLVVSPDGKKVYVANPLDSSFSIISTAPTQAASAASGLPGHMVDTPEGPLLVQASTFAPWIVPWTLLIDPRSVGTPTPILIVINRGSATSQDLGSVGFLNMRTDQPDPRVVAVGTNSEQSAFDPDLPQAIVTNFGSNNISFVNTTNATASAPVGVGTAPVAVAVALQTPGEITAAFESPEAGPVSGIAVIRGWAFSTQVGSQISRVELFSEGTRIGDIPCCSERGDVQAAFPQFPAANTFNSGWGTIFNWGLLSAGTHTVQVQIRNTSGELLSTETRTVTVVKPGDFEFLDRFSFAGATARIAGDDLVVEGVVVRDKASQQQKRLTARFRWFTNQWCQSTHKLNSAIERRINP